MSVITEKILKPLQADPMFQPVHRKLIENQVDEASNNEMIRKNKGKPHWLKH